MSGAGGSFRPPGPRGTRRWDRRWVWALVAVLALVAGAAVRLWVPWGGEPATPGASTARTVSPVPSTTVTTARPPSSPVPSSPVPSSPVPPSPVPSSTAPAPTTSTTAGTALTVDALTVDLPDVMPRSLASEWPSWRCEQGPLRLTPSPAPGRTTGPLPAGSVAVCTPSPLPEEGEYPVVTVLVIDDAGTYVATQDGLVHPILGAHVGADGELLGGWEPVPAGLNCTRLLASGSPFALTAQREHMSPAQRYFGTVLYYFLQQRSPLMDADGNGIPCETRFDAATVRAVWGGGWVPDATDS